MSDTTWHSPALTDPLLTRTGRHRLAGMELAVALASVLVGLGGIVVAAGGLFVAQRTLKVTEGERAAGLRQALYEAQAAAVVEVSAAVSTFVVDATGAFKRALKTRAGALDDEEREQVVVDMATSFSTLSNLLFRYWAVLPANVVETINVLLDAFSGITARTSERERWPAEYVNDADPAHLVRVSGRDVIRAMRAGLGTDPLNQQTLDRIGRPRP
jgi:hypothetical protein